MTERFIPAKARIAPARHLKAPFLGAVRQENKGLKRILLAGKCVEKACHTESMPALPRFLSGQNLSFSGATQFSKRKFPSRQNEKHRQYLCVLPRLFMKRGRKFSFENPMFLISPRLMECFAVLNRRFFLTAIPNIRRNT